jgi:tetratricopeptide (TPR) repeat protein
MRRNPSWSLCLGVFALFLVVPGPVAAGPSVDQLIRLAQRQIARTPSQAIGYYRLGDAYVQKARETGDMAYVALAETALRKSLAIAPRLGGASRHLAYVLYLRHAFAEAAVEAQRAIELDPADAHAHGVLGDAYLETGRYAEARQAYTQMARLDAGLYSLSRLAGLRSLEGDPAGAIGDLERAIAEGKAAGRPAESIAWAQWQLGTEHASLGRLEAAEASYRAALETSPRYHRALAGLAQVRGAQGRYPEAIALYEAAVAIVPQADYVVALGDVLAKAGRCAAARQQYELVEYIGRLSALNQVLYNRELAYFYADHHVHLDRGLDLARRELEVRRDVYGYDVLAWALYQNGRLGEAHDAITRALSLGTRDARLFFHAGLIERALGRPDRARRHLRAALETNPGFHVLLTDEARRVLAELEREVALTSTWEERSAE